ncbi:ABC transporter permease [Salisaeta longa]|uniref:ABC transporter permease n=1 Tax=Salisaeta longa TaxID=503170 RepID=UPI0003B6A74A|nr:ABC transporter permease [Salisaeta longa]
MRIVDLCRLAWNSIGRNATRSALTGIGVAIAVAALFALLSYGAGLQQVARSEYNALQLYNTLRVTTHYIPSLTSPREAMSAPQEPVPLTDSLVQAIEAVSGVRAAYPEVTFPATVDANGQRLPVAGEAIPQTFQSIAAYQPISGRFFSSSNAAEVLLSPSVARRLGFTPAASVVGDTIQLSTASLNFDRLTSMAAVFSRGIAALPMGRRVYDVRVAGLLPQAQQPLSGLTRVLLPLGFAKSLKKISFFSTMDLIFRNAETQEGYQAVRVQLAEGTRHDAVTQRIEAMGVYVTSFRDQFGRVEQLFLVLDLALGIIGGIALIVAVIGIANTIMMNIRERYPEIGVMMAVGGDARDLRRLFVAESGLLGMLGATAGLLLGFGVVEGIDAVLAFYLQRMGLPLIEVFAHPWPLLLGIWGGAVLISVLAGWAPARRASRIEPVSALRSV